jgi:hypothetical protein
MHSAFDLLNMFVRNIQEKKIPLVDVRYKEYSIEAAYSGDYDFFTSSVYLDEILNTLFILATELQICFTIDRSKSTKTRIVLFENSGKTIFLEIWTSLEVKDPHKKTLQYIFWEDLLNHLDRSVFPVKLPIRIEALYYLSHLYTKRKNLTSPDIQKRLHYYAQHCKLEDISSLYDELMRRGGAIHEISHRANMFLMEMGVLKANNAFRLRLLELKIKIFSEFRKNKADILKFQRFIPVVGPDGVGKTTLIESLIKSFQKRSQYYRFKKTYRGSFIYNAIYPLLKLRTKKYLNVTKIDKNQVDDLYGNFIFNIALIKYTLFIATNLLIRKFRFADRFFYDLILQNMRFDNKISGLRENWRSLLKKTPNVFWLIQLDAPDTVIHERKKELSEADILTYRLEIFKLYLHKPSIHYTYINTANTLETCTEILLKNSKSLL